MHPNCATVDTDNQTTVYISEQPC